MSLKASNRCLGEAKNKFEGSYLCQIIVKSINRLDLVCRPGLKNLTSNDVCLGLRGERNSKNTFAFILIERVLSEHRLPHRN